MASFDRTLFNGKLEFACMRHLVMMADNLFLKNGSFIYARVFTIQLVTTLALAHPASTTIASHRLSYRQSPLFSSFKGSREGTVRQSMAQQRGELRARGERKGEEKCDWGGREGRCGDVKIAHECHYCMSCIVPYKPTCTFKNAFPKSNQHRQGNY